MASNEGEQDAESIFLGLWDSYTRALNELQEGIAGDETAASLRLSRRVGGGKRKGSFLKEKGGEGETEEDMGAAGHELVLDWHMVYIS